jgi:DNA-directed RNA polymerase subunit beta'
MVIKYLPILPANFRPIIILKDNTLSKTDLNNLYAKIININNKIKKLLKFNIPKKIITAETSLLQENIDKLIVEKKTTTNLTKSLSKRMEGKTGHFRKNLLGKTVDYSGRSVITVEPKLNINQCGLPKKIVTNLKIIF